MGLEYHHLKTIPSSQRIHDYGDFFRSSFWENEAQAQEMRACLSPPGSPSAMGTVTCISKASRCAMRDIIHLLECLLNLQEVLSSIPRTRYKSRHVGQGSS